MNAKQSVVWSHPIFGYQTKNMYIALIVFLLWVLTTGKLFIMKLWFSTVSFPFKGLIYLSIFWSFIYKLFKVTCVFFIKFDWLSIHLIIIESQQIYQFYIKDINHYWLVVLFMLWLKYLWDLYNWLIENRQWLIRKSP